MFLYQAKNTARIDSFRLLFKKWHLIALNVVIITLTTVTNIGATWALKTIVDVAIPQKQMDTLFFAIAALVFLPVLSMFLVSGNNMISVKISGHITDSLRNRMFEKITRLSPNIMSKYKVGDLVARVTRSCGWVGEAYVQSVVLPGISSAFMFIGILIFLFFLNWQLTLVSLLIVPLLIAASIFAGKKSKQKNEQLYAFLQKADSYFTEVISGIKTVQMYTQEKRECDYVSQWIKDHRKISNQANILHIWVIDILNKFEQAFGTGLVLAFGAWQVLGGGLTVGSLIAFTIYIPQLYTYGEKIQRIYVSSKQFAPTIKGIEEILELPDEFVDILQAVPMETIKGNIQFHNVSFSYAENRGKVQDRENG
jgi:ABC-type bacteriocin/lantibiotic exporter with double-glycine peptidase domain